MVFINSLQSEWLKTKRSTSFWLCIIGGFFIPLIQLCVYLYKGFNVNKYPDVVNIWQVHYNMLWDSMITFLLPMGVILSSSLITQLEYKNNTWKQVHTTPQTFATVFFAKLGTILLMTLQFFIFFNIGIVLSAVIPTLLADGSLPKQPLPVWLFIKSNAKIYITILPIIAIQYLISLRFKNFLVPIGLGMLFLIGSLILVPMWDKVFLSPYSYCLINVFVDARNNLPINLYAGAGIYFVVLTAINYYLYSTRAEKG